VQVILLARSVGLLPTFSGSSAVLLASYVGCSLRWAPPLNTSDLLSSHRLCYSMLNGWSLLGLKHSGIVRDIIDVRRTAADAPVREPVPHDPTSALGCRQTGVSAGAQAPARCGSATRRLLRCDGRRRRHRRPVRRLVPYSDCQHPYWQYPYPYWKHQRPYSG
jgi:hypothetical protein